MSENKKKIDSVLSVLNEAISDKDFYLMNSLNLILTRKYCKEAKDIQEVVIKKNGNFPQKEEKNLNK